MSGGRSGIRDWKWQRFSAIYLAGYLIYLVAFLGTSSHLNYAQWFEFMHHPWVKATTFLALISLLIHAWIGVWTIATDYLKPPVIRLSFLGLVMVALGIYFAWGIQIMWGF
jgi:succinate dehydrogenase / fumarate reductase membrane anchor subunit